MDITVILCTYNRCNLLPNALMSVVTSEMPAEVKWEILVVDNNSRDRTRDVVEDFQRRYPGRLRYIFEPQPGKSHALNSGIRCALGHILAFVDDDVTVQSDWLDKLTAVLLREAQWAGSGGRILPLWSKPQPRWLSVDGKHALGPLAMFDFGTQSCELTEPPFGTNMAFRKGVFDKHGNFRVDLGPRPGSEIRSEDTEFGQRLIAAGERLWYEPSAVVFHPVPEQRLTRAYFLKWWLDHGYAEVRVFGLRPGTRFYMMGIPMYLFRNLIMAIVRWMFQLRPDRRFYYKTKVWCKAGQILECYRHSREARSVRQVAVE
jgi:glycosyltransferase involved in cell wall biosynthesis